MKDILSLKFLLDKLRFYFPKETLTFSNVFHESLTGISLDLMKLKEDAHIIDNVSLTYFFKTIEHYFSNIREFSFLMSPNTKFDEVFEYIASTFQKLSFLISLKCKFCHSLSFINKESILKLCFGLKNLRNLREIHLDFSGMNLFYENLALIGNELGRLPFLNKLILTLDKTNVTNEMICSFNSNFSEGKTIESYSLGFKNNNLREISLRKLLKNIKISFLELKCLSLDLSFNSLRKESIMYCIRKCLKNVFCSKLEEVELNFENNETKTKNYLTIETSYEIIKQEFDKLNIQKYHKPIKNLKVNLKNNEILIADYLLFTRFFQFVAKTECLTLDFQENYQIYDNLLLVKLLEMMFVINDSLLEINLAFERLDVSEIELYKSLPTFQNLKVFSITTKILTFSNKAMGSHINGLCSMMHKMVNLSKLNLIMPFYEYNHSFFISFTNALGNFSKLEFLTLDLNYIYLFRSQCESLIKALKELKNLKCLDLLLRLKCDFNKKFEVLEDVDFENVVFVYESLPDLIDELIKLISLRVICFVNGEECNEALEFHQAKQIYLLCLKKKKKFINLEIGDKMLRKISQNMVGRFLAMSKSIEFLLKNVFKRKEIRNEILEKCL